MHTGELEAGGERGPVSYTLDIQVSGGLKSGSGQMTGGASLLWAAFNADKARLHDGSGKSAPVIITNYSPGSASATYRLGGAFT